LPEPIARGVEALREKQIGRVLRPDVRDAPPVNANVDGIAEAGNSEALVGHA
jgi:hypothetical protein